MVKSRFQIAKADIKALFEKSPQKIYTENDISGILRNQRKFWRLPVSLTAAEFTGLLVQYTHLKVYKFNFPRETITRYSWDNVSPYEIAISLKKNAYLSHFSALYINNLTDQVPKKIYVTHEQPEKPARSSELSQTDIDESFTKPVRVSNNFAKFDDYTICLLNGQFTNRAGIIQTDTEGSGLTDVTGIERTLIDIAVRPVYSGGIFEVQKAFIRARDYVSINKLTALLKKLNFVYPYHQVIGFYLERSGVYNESQINLIRNMERTRKFFLTHDMGEMDYSEEWNLYYPKGFQG
jgi:predicted transcriptional regulator of viral defense system